MRPALAALACAALACATSAKRPPPAAEPFRYQGYFATYPTGLRLVAYRTSDVKRATVLASYDAGEADDPPGKEGLARLVARLTAVAAPARGGFELRERLFAAGALDSTSVRADATEFRSIVRLARLDEALAVEADRLREPLAGVTAEDVAREREQLALDLAADPAGSELAAVLALASRGTRYDRAPPTAASVRALTMEDVRAWARERLVPARLVLVVSGPETPSATGRRVLAAFGALAATGAPDEPRVPPTVRPSAPPRAPAPSSALETLHLPGATPHLWIAWPLPGETDGTAASALAAIVVLDSRLGYRAGRADLAGRVRGIRVSLQRRHDASAILARVELRGADDAAFVRDALVAAGRDERPLADKGQLRLVRSLAQTIDATGVWDVEEGVAGDAAQLLRATGERDPLSVLARQAHTQLGVSFEAYYRTTLTPDRAVSVSVLPDGTAPPTTAPLDEPGAWIPVVATLGAAAPGAADVLEIVEPAAFDRAFRTRLPNGLQVVVVPHGELPLVEARLLVDADPVDGPGGDLVPYVALALSEKAWTLAESYGCARSSAWIWREKVSFRERGPTSRLPEMLDRLACWTRRSLDGDRVDHLRKAAGNAEGSPSATAWAALRSAIYSPDGELLEGERLAGVPASSAVRWMREQLRPERSVLVLAGKISPTPELLAELERRFGSWKAFGPAPRDHAAPALPERRRVVLIDVPGAERVTFGVAARLPRRAEVDEAATLAVAQALSLRLRAATGPAANVFMNVGGVPHSPFLSAWATVSAKRAPSSITAALEALRELSAEPLTSVDANLVRWLVARWQSFRFDTLDGLSGGVEDLFFADLPLEAWERLPTSIAALTPERIRAAAQAAAVGREVVVVQGDAATLAPALRDAGLSPEVLPAPKPAR